MLLPLPPFITKCRNERIIEIKPHLPKVIVKIAVALIYLGHGVVFCAAVILLWFSWVLFSVPLFLRATAGTAIARLSHRNSVCLSVCHTGGSGKNGAS